MEKENGIIHIRNWIRTNGDMSDDGKSITYNCKELEGVIAEALRQQPVSGSLLCHHNFIQKDTYWKSCTHCGMLAPLGQ